MRKKIAYVITKDLIVDILLVNILLVLNILVSEK